MRKRSRKALRRVLAELAVGATLVCGVSAWQSRDLVPPGARAPAHAMPALGGGEVSFATGTVTVVYFFAPWCGVCKLASSNLRLLAALLGPARVVITAVALDYERPADVQAYADAHPFPGAVALGDAAVAKAFRVTAFPTYYVLDKNLAVRHASVGYSTLAGLLLRVWLTGITSA